MAIQSSGTWFLVAILILIVYLVMKVSSKKQEVAIGMTWFLFLFIVFTTTYLYISSDYKLTTFDGFAGFVKHYFSWLGAMFENVKTITTNAINLDWGANHTR